MWLLPYFASAQPQHHHQHHHHHHLTNGPIKSYQSQSTETVNASSLTRELYHGHGAFVGDVGVVGFYQLN